jgi:pilus assembly protein Flp/PilA
MVRVMVNFVSAFFRDERGATALEYALIMIIVAVGIVASLVTLKTALIQTFTSIAAFFAN